MALAFVEQGDTIKKLTELTGKLLKIYIFVT